MLQCQAACKRGVSPCSAVGDGASKIQKRPNPHSPDTYPIKNDPSEYVRKSIANNLNDISKTRPDVVVKIATEWYGENKHTDWLLKHGCRTLLKQGNRDILALFGVSDNENLEVSEFALETASISIGDDFIFSFAIFVKEATKARLEYGMDYVKSNGKTSRKIFILSEVSLKANEKKAYKQ